MGSMATHFGGDQTMQMYGDFDGFPLHYVVHCLGCQYNDPC